MSELYTSDRSSTQDTRLGRTGPVVLLILGLLLVLTASVAVLINLRSGLQAPPLRTQVDLADARHPATEAAGADSRALAVALPPDAVVVEEATEPDLPPTDPHLGVGAVVEAAHTGELGVRLRAGPGLDTLTFEIYPEGSRFTIIEHTGDLDIYPVPRNNYTWWRVRAEDGLVGWLAQEFMVLVDGQ